MPKWVRKAESLGITGPCVKHHIGATALRDIVEESRTSLDDLQFVINHTDFSGNLTSDKHGLMVAEEFCRNNDAWKQRRESFPDETVHRLIALFVGHVFEENECGKWKAYPGRFHVFHPIVIELANDPGSYIQPFLYCHELRTNMNLPGARSGESLTMLFNAPAKNATR